MRSSLLPFISRSIFSFVSFMPSSMFNLVGDDVDDLPRITRHKSRRAKSANLFDDAVTDPLSRPACF